jgi:hypothetical protein
MLPPVSASFINSRTAANAFREEGMGEMPLKTEKATINNVAQMTITSKTICR